MEVGEEGDHIPISTLSPLLPEYKRHHGIHTFIRNLRCIFVLTLLSAEGLQSERNRRIVSF